MMKQENTKIVGKNGIEVIVPLTDKNKEYDLLEKAKDFMDTMNKKVELIDQGEDPTTFEYFLNDLNNQGEEVMDKNDEMILVFDKEVFESIGLIDDMLEVDVLAPLTKEDYEYMIGLLNDMWETGGSVQRRGDMEEDMSYLQPIPYTVIKQGNKYFTYTRLEGGGESRLHGKSSIGIGGHANNTEYAWSFEHLLAVNNSRELEEEVFIRDENGEEIDFHYELTKESVITGLMYNQTTEVDSLHLGVLNIISIPETWTVEPKETDTLEGKFLTKQEIQELDLENWTASALSVLQ